MDTHAESTKVAPAQPPVGEADPSAALSPAETIVNEENKTSSKTPATESKTTIDASDPEEELRKLCDEADAKAKELVGPYYDLQVRISGELFPILLRIKTLLLHGEWTLWYESFCKRHHITTSLRTVQRAFADLSENRLLSDGKSIPKSSRNSAVVQAAKNLADAKENLGKSADDGNEQAKAIIADYEKKHEDALAQAHADTSADAKAKPSAEMRVNKRLAAIVEVAERYIRIMERVVNTATVTDRQKKDLEKASEAWAEVLCDARELGWAVKVIEDAA